MFERIPLRQWLTLSEADPIVVDRVVAPGPLEQLSDGTILENEEGTPWN